MTLKVFLFEVTVEYTRENNDVLVVSRQGHGLIPFRPQTPHNHKYTCTFLHGYGKLRADLIKTVCSESAGGGFRTDNFNYIEYRV
jgi:hypothetical protein